MSVVFEAPQPLRADLLRRSLDGRGDLAVHAAVDLLRRMGEMERGLVASRAAVKDMEGVIEQLTRPPRSVAGIAACNHNGHCLVATGNSRQEMNTHPSLHGEKFQVGDAVAVNPQDNLIVARLRDYRPPGRVSRVYGSHGDKLLVDYLPEQPIAVDVSPAVAAASPQEGDKVLWNEEWKIAIDVVERVNHVEYDECEPVRADQIGGLDAQLDELLLAIESQLIMADRSRELELKPLRGALLVGPPGTGKTLLVRALVTVLREKHGKSVLFRNVPPGSWRDPFFGVSDRKLIEPLQWARRMIHEGKADVVILFYDELDTLGSRSGEVTNLIDSRLLNGFNHELDGLSSTNGVLALGATNRTDLVDESLLRPGRFGGLILDVGRPDREAARAIFRCHLRPTVRFASNGEPASPDEMVDRSINAAMGVLFADADPLSALAELILHGGQRRLVYPGEVVSGAIIANVVQRAKRLALRRAMVGPAGLVPGDFAHAADVELDSIAERLTDPFKAREILGDRTLPVARGESRRSRRIER